MLWKYCILLPTYSYISLFADGPIDAKKLSNPYNSKTTAALVDLFENYPLNDDSESGSGFVESSSGMEPDTLKALVKSVSDRVFCGKTLDKLLYFIVFIELCLY